MCVCVCVYTHTHTHTKSQIHTCICWHTVCYSSNKNTHLNIRTSLSNNKSSKYKELLSSLVFSSTHTHTHTHTNTHNQKNSLASSHIAQFVLKQAIRGDTRFSKHTNMNKNYINTWYFKVTSRHHCLLHTHTHIRKVLSIYSVCTTLYIVIYFNCKNFFF